MKAEFLDFKGKILWLMKSEEYTIHYYRINSQTLKFPKYTKREFEAFIPLFSLDLFTKSLIK